MKISELKKGMLLTSANDNECFSIYGVDSKWLNVIPKPSKRLYGYSKPWRPNTTKSKIAVYLGTKKDLSIDIKWTDKFVLIDNEVIGVDPSAWRKIKKVQ